MSANNLLGIGHLLRLHPFHELLFGHIAKHAHHDGSTLKQAALALGYVTEQEFVEWVQPQKMTYPE